MLVGKTKFCISPKPIIEIDELEYVTDILYDDKLKVHYINIGISSSGMNTLNQIRRAMPNAEFGYVMENNVIGRFRLHEGIIYARYMKLGMDVDLKTVKMIQAIFKKYITLTER